MFLSALFSEYLLMTYLWIYAIYHILLQILANVSSDLRERFEVEVQKRLDEWRQGITGMKWIPFQEIEKKRNEIRLKLTYL